MGIEGRKTRLNQVIRGWMNYFKLADAKKLIQGLDKWIRSRMRMVTWKRWKKAGLPHVRFHDLRHSCVGLLLSNGVPMERIRDWVGHSAYQNNDQYL